MAKAEKERYFYEFGPFRIDRDRRQLLRENQPVTLQRKTFDVLFVLVENSGKVVSKDDLLKAVWPDAFVEESNLSQHIFVLRKTLSDGVEEKRYIVTVPGRGYRFDERVNVVAVGEILVRQAAPKLTDAPKLADEKDRLVVASHTRSRMLVEEEPTPALPAKTKGPWIPLVALSVVASLTAAAAYLYLHRHRKLTEKDTIVLADVANNTGDPVFDVALRQGLSAQLDQSPFLNLLSDSRTAQTLSLMGKPKDAPLTPQLAREVCQRTASAAVLDGSIAQIGTRFLLTLKATACPTGETLASTGAEAIDKNHVLDAMGKIATDIRRKLGESLTSIQKYDVRPEDVTTPSLEALHSYSLAMKNRTGNFDPFVQLVKRAIEQDPNFAMAYVQLGVAYINIGENEQGAQNIRKAYDLRDHVSEREKLYIASHYDHMVNGDLEAARKDYELWREIYPRDQAPNTGLAAVYYLTGQFDKILPLVDENMELAGLRPSDTNIGTVWAWTFMNRIDDAKAMALKGQASTHNPLYDMSLYSFAFLQGDVAARQHELEILTGNPTWGDSALDLEANTLAYFGQFAKSREFLRRAVDAALKQDKKESAASYYAEAALAEALVGNAAQAKQFVKKALALADTKDTRAMSALALTLAGDAVQATKLAGDLGKRYPKDTIIQSNYLPTVDAAAQLRTSGSKPDPQKSIQLLASTTPYESGVTALDNGICFYPVFIRGQALLANKQGPAAAAEFRRILDTPQMVQMEPLGFMAHLGLARAYAIGGDSAKSRAEYQTFLTLWKDADADVPLLKQARAEFAKLH